jgi:HK97 family phage prohead protease
MGVELPADFFVKPIDGHDDLLAFSYDFGVKALEDGGETVTELENGDLIIEGMAAVFDGVDRQDENFTDGAFQRGIKSFLGGQASLCFHHKNSKCLGKVLDLQEIEGKGLKMKARVDGAIKSHPELGTYYHQIKNGTLSGLSVGGFFKRKLTEKGWRITDMDFTEISVTPVPVHPGTNFAVVAGKALADLEIPKKPAVDGEIRGSDEDELKFLLSQVSRIFDALERRGDGQSKSTTTLLD